MLRSCKGESERYEMSTGQVELAAMFKDLLIERLKEQNGDLLARIAELEVRLELEKKKTADLTEHIRNQLSADNILRITLGLFSSSG